MADEQSKLQIILEAVNQTDSPFKALTDTMQALQRSAEEVSRAAASAFKSLSSSMSESTMSIEGSAKADQSAFSDIARSASEQMKSAGESLSSVSQSASEMEKVMSESATSASRDMQQAAAGVSEFEKVASSGFSGASSEMNNLRSNMEKGIGQIGGLIAIQQLGQSMEELGKKGESLFHFAVEQGSDFEQSMKNIQTVIATNITTHESWNQKLKDSTGLTDQLQQKALDLGSRGAQSANEVAAAMDAMLRSGVDAKTILNGAAQSAQNVAIVTGDSLDESANLVTEIYHQFREAFAQNGKSVQENMKETGDVLTGTLLSAKISSQDFLDTLKYVGPVASQLGSSFTDTATATALLAQNGIKGSQAGNNLKRALTSLLEPTKQGAEAMAHLGLIQNGHNMLIDESTGKMKNLTDIQEILHKSMDGLTEAKKAQYIHDMFGQYALAGTLVLANENSEAFANLREKIGGISAEDAANNMLNNFNGHMSKLRANLQTTAKEFGLAFIPVLEKLIPIGQAVLNWFKELTPANKEFLMGILAVGSGLAVAGGALAMFAISAKFAGEGIENLRGIFTTALSGIKSFALAVREVGLAEAFMDAMSPMGWVVLIGAAVAGAAMIIMQNWGAIKSFLLSAWNEIKATALSVWNSITSFFSDTWNSIKTTTTTVWNGITTTATNAWNGLVNGVKNIWNGFTSWIGNAAKAAMQFVVDAFQWMYNHNYFFKNWVDNLVAEWNWIRDTTLMIWNGIRQFLSDTWNDIKQVATVVWDAIKAFFEQRWNNMVTNFKAVWTPVSKFFSDLWHEVSDVAVNVWDAIAGFMEQRWNNLVNNAKSIFNGLGSFFTGLWNEAYNWGANLVHMIAQGISNAAHEVADAAKNVAHSIASFLGFHSPAKEGPGADADVWMPNLFKMLNEQIQQQIPNMNALLNLAFHPSMTGVTNMTTYNYMSPAIAGGSAGYGGGVTIGQINVTGNVTRNEQGLANIVQKTILENIKQQGKLG